MIQSVLFIGMQLFFLFFLTYLQKYKFGSFYFLFFVQVLVTSFIISSAIFNYLGF